MLERKDVLSNIEKKLVAEFSTNKKELDRLEAERKRILRELSEQAPHKVGDVVKWVETGRTRNVGTWHEPKTIKLADSERKAVVKKVSPWIVVEDGKVATFGYQYTFVVLKKDGFIGVNEVYVSGPCDWTGEYVNIEYRP